MCAAVLKKASEPVGGLSSAAERGYAAGPSLTNVFQAAAAAARASCAPARACSVQTLCSYQLPRIQGKAGVAVHKCGGQAGPWPGLD